RDDAHRHVGGHLRLYGDRDHPVTAAHHQGVGTVRDRLPGQREGLPRPGTGQPGDLEPVGAQPAGGPVRHLLASPAARGRIDQQGDRPDPAVRQMRAHGMSVPGLHTPRGSTALFTARSIRTPTSPISDSRYGRWSTPTAWWWVMVPRAATIASEAARLASAHWATGSAPRWPATTVKYRDAPVG